MKLDKTFITAPTSAPHLQDFFRQYPVEDISVVLFFKFREFSSSQRQDAGVEYKKRVYDHAHSLCASTVTASMTADWHNGKNERTAYWKELRAEEEELQAAEKENNRLQQHVRNIEADVMERSDIVSSVLTRKVKANAKAKVASLRTPDGSPAGLEPKRPWKTQPTDNIAERHIEEQREEERQDEEEVEDDDDDGIGYTTTDLYESDDLSHLDRLGGQVDDDQITDEGSDAASEGNATKAVDDRETPVYSRKKRKTMKCRPFNLKGKASSQRRYESVGRKWALSSSGKFVEDLLFKIGMACEYYHPVHSFMVDCDDKWLACQFTAEEWMEICEGWPEVSISAEMSAYIESFADVDTLAGLKNALSVRPEGLEEQLVYRCLKDCSISTQMTHHHS